MSEMTLVFQYGSNMSTARFNAPDRLDGAAELVGPAHTVEPFRFDFTVWSRNNQCAAADIVLDPSGRQIWGVIFDVPTNRIYRDTAPPGTKALDAIEGEGGNYSREQIKVYIGGSTDSEREVVTYVVRDRKKGLRTSAEYIEHILCGLYEYAASADYIAYIRDRIIENNPELKERIRVIPVRPE